MKIQSNGMGMQSIAMYLMSNAGLLPRFNYSIFADPGKEKKETYDYALRLEKWSLENDGVPIIWDRSKNLYRDLLNGENSTGQRFASIPGYTLNEDGTKGMLRRQCTHEYKIMVVEENMKNILGIKKGQSYPNMVQVFIGISLDEATRIARPQRKNLEYVYPFCNVISGRDYVKRGDYKTYTRSELISWMNENHYPIPVKSSCIFCPFQADSNWLEHKKNGEWNEIIKIDKSIRDSSKKGINQKMFLHKSCKPIDEVDLKENQTQLDFNCGPFCNV